MEITPGSSRPDRAAPIASIAGLARQEGKWLRKRYSDGELSLLDALRYAPDDTELLMRAAKVRSSKQLDRVMTRIVNKAAEHIDLSGFSRPQALGLIRTLLGYFDASGNPTTASSTEGWPVTGRDRTSAPSTSPMALANRPRGRRR